MSDEMVFDVDLDEFDRRVIKESHNIPILVDFWADWCSPCHALTPHLLTVVKGFAGKVRLAKVEVDEGENMKLAGRYKLRGFPTVVLFGDGDEVARFSGAHPPGWIERWLTDQLSE